MILFIIFFLASGNSRNDLDRDSSTGINGFADADSRERSVQLPPEQHEVRIIL